MFYLEWYCTYAFLLGHPTLCKDDIHDEGAFNVHSAYVKVLNVGIKTDLPSIGNKARIEDFKVFECYDDRYKP